MDHGTAPGRPGRPNRPDRPDRAGRQDRQDRQDGQDGQHGQWYEIRLRGRLAAHWAARFDGLTLTALDDGTTLLRGPVTDQAALHGVLRQLADIGIPLLSLRQQDHDTDPTPSTPGD